MKAGKRNWLTGNGSIIALSVRKARSNTMAKYRGKYKKCRDCKHAKEVMMYIVQTKESCPKHVNFSGTLAVDKPTCERCEYFEPKEVEHNA